MGVKDFTKVFPPKKEITLKELKGKNIVIDASTEIYRAALGMKTTEVLTDSNGIPSSHINTILLGIILKLKSAGIFQYWVFDYGQKPDDETYHNPLKQLELKKRSEKKKKAKEQIEVLKKNIENLNIESELFSDSENEKDLKTTEFKEQIEKQEKVAFQLKKFYIEDTIFMLDMLDIPWIEAPAGFDAEQICAIATNDENIFKVRIDYVLTPDVDALLFGAKKVIKRDIRAKKLYEYDLSILLEENDISQQDLIKIGLILGTDFAKKTPKIGPKTVLKKYKDIELDEDQENAKKFNFNRKITKEEIEKIVINNNDAEPFKDGEKYTLLLDWIEKVKSYNRARIVKQFVKNDLFTDVN